MEAEHRKLVKAEAKEDQSVDAGADQHKLVGGRGLPWKQEVEDFRKSRKWKTAVVVRGIRLRWYSKVEDCGGTLKYRTAVVPGGIGLVVLEGRGLRWRILVKVKDTGEYGGGNW